VVLRISACMDVSAAIDKIIILNLSDTAAERLFQSWPH
jgi:hypothetical protein